MFSYFVVCTGLSNGDVGVAGGTVVHEIRPGAGFETSDFVKEELERFVKNSPAQEISFRAEPRFLVKVG